jgi:hypothetical protein
MHGRSPLGDNVPYRSQGKYKTDDMDMDGGCRKGVELTRGRGKMEVKVRPRTILPAKINGDINAASTNKPLYLHFHFGSQQPPPGYRALCIPPSFSIRRIGIS